MESNRHGLSGELCIMTTSSPWLQPVRTFIFHLFKYRKEDEKHFINEDTGKFTLVLIRQMPR